jgi:hypothetical protein
MVQPPSDASRDKLERLLGAETLCVIVCKTLRQDLFCGTSPVHLERSAFAVAGRQSGQRSSFLAAV